jgi:hypothetical protein
MSAPLRQPRWSGGVSLLRRDRRQKPLAITADTLGGQKITYQVGYIGFDKANQNAVVLQKQL